MNLIIQFGLLGLVLGLGLGLGFILYCRIWRPLALPYMCPQPLDRPIAGALKAFINGRVQLASLELPRASLHQNEKNGGRNSRLGQAF